jgi:heat shock protein HtpX
MLLLALLLMLIALMVVLLLRYVCRSLFQRAHPPEWMKLMVTQLSHELGIRRPDLYALSTEGINAFALGDARASGVIFFHEQMLAHLTQDEVESVLAHEMAHLASGHAMLMTFLQGMTAPIIVPLAGSASFFMALLFGIRGFRHHFIHVYHMLSVLLFPITTILIALVMRQWEYDADARAARLVGKAKYIAALQCLHGSFFQHPDLLNLSSSQSAASNDQWALSHPSLKQRIHALRQVG